MKRPSEQIDHINNILNVVDTFPDKGKSLVNYDALQAIRKVLDRKNQWDILSEKTVLKRTLKKNLVTVN
jgi:hypothetical protein